MKKRLLDYFGISAATLCSIHCIAFPLISILPLQWHHNHWIDLFFALIGLTVVFRITRKPHSKSLVFWLWLSIFIILISTLISLLGWYHSRLIHLGAFGLIAGHIVNAGLHKTKPSPVNLPD